MNYELTIKTLAVNVNIRYVDIITGRGIEDIGTLGTVLLIIIIIEFNNLCNAL